MDEEQSKEAPSKNSSTGIVIGIVVVVVIFILIAIVGSSASSTNSTQPPATNNVTQTADTQQSPCVSYNDANAFAQNASSVSYRALEKDPSSYMGIAAVFTGQVVQILEQNGQGVIRLAVTKDSFGDWDSGSIVYVQYAGHNDVVDDDVVTVYGLLAGPQTYTSQANFQITVPSMYACFITKKSATAATQKTAAPSTVNTPQTQQTNAAPSQPATPATWHTVLTYTGPDTQNTAPFSMQGSQWRITYSCTLNSGQYGGDSSLFQGIINSVSNGAPVDIFANGSCPQNNTSYSYSNPPGQYALQVQSFSATYSIKIEDYY